MKNNKRKKCIICWILILMAFFNIFVFYRIANIPNILVLREGQKLRSNYIIRVNNSDRSIKKDNDRDIQVSLFGILPLKSVNVKSISDIMVFPGGEPIGVKLNTDGVLVVAISDVVLKDSRTISPAVDAGIKVGDSIIKINGVKVKCTEHLVKEINKSRNNTIKLTINRKGKIFSKNIKAIKNEEDGQYKIGLWIRDCTSGVGTLTFYDINGNKFGALGHPITDLDTGTILRIDSGEIVNSSIISVRKGEKGNPGELKGIFIEENQCIGNVYKNTKSGIYGMCNGNFRNIRNSKKSMKIALKNEIKEGPAQIITTIKGSEPKCYNIMIEKLLNQSEPNPKSMIIRVTDKRLLRDTGGIVQGMSGSPIIQNNKIVGAVTHVLINKPDVGYGIYIEWMLKEAGILAN